LERREAEVEIVVEYDNDDDAKMLYSALLPETMSLPTERERTFITRKGNIVEIRIIAMDITALRAAVNACLRWVKIAEDIKLLLVKKDSRRD